MDIPVEYNPAIIMRDKGFKMGKQSAFVDKYPQNGIPMGVYQGADRAGLTYENVQGMDSAARNYYMTQNMKGGTGAVNKYVPRVQATVTGTQSPSVNPVTGEAIVTPGMDGYTGQATYGDPYVAPGTSALAGTTNTGFNMQGTGNQAAGYGVQNYDGGGNVGDVPAGAPTNANADSQTQGIKNANTEAHTAWLNKQANPGFDWYGATNTALGAASTIGTLYDNFWGDGADMREAQIEGLEQNIKHAGENQAAEKKRVAGVNSMFS